MSGGRLIGGLLTAIVSLACASGAVVQATSAALASTTSDAAGAWSVGAVAVGPASTGGAAFTATNLKPGATGTRCVEVARTGSPGSAVRLYGTAFSTTHDLARWLDLAVTTGTGGTLGGGCGSFVPDRGPELYRGTLAGFAAGSACFSTGLGARHPADARVYRFRYTLRRSAPNSVQAGTASIAFTWESQHR